MVSASVYAEAMVDMNKTERGSMAENLALAYLQSKGLRLVARNYKTPGRGGGEVDLIMQSNDAERTLVFVEVRQRAGHLHGGAAASVGVPKQRRIVFAARYYLLRLAKTPPCRFDVISIDGDLHVNPNIEWIVGAFEAPSF